MALPATSGSPVSPTSLPVVGQSGAPGAPPPGPQQGMTMPTANRGLDVKGMTMMRVAADVLIEALSSGMDPGSEAGRAATKAINDLGKHIPEGSINPQIYNATLLQLFNKQRQQAPMLAAMRSQGQQMPQPQAQQGQAPSPMPQPQGGAPTPMAA